MILRCVVDDEDVRYRYNFNDGDFSEYNYNAGFYCISDIISVDKIH